MLFDSEVRATAGPGTRRSCDTTVIQNVKLLNAHLVVYVR